MFCRSTMLPVSIIPKENGMNLPQNQRRKKKKDKRYNTEGTNVLLQRELGIFQFNN